MKKTNKQSVVQVHSELIESQIKPKGNWRKTKKKALPKIMSQELL